MTPAPALDLTTSLRGDCTKNGLEERLLDQAQFSACSQPYIARSRPRGEVGGGVGGVEGGGRGGGVEKVGGGRGGMGWVGGGCRGVG